MAKYRTIQTSAEGFYKEKGFKFLAFAVPVSSEEDIKAFIAQKRKAHPQAVHVCSAFRLGADHKAFRSSDDGEPSNSAGPPILGQIQAYNLTNVLVAVVRYYGGTNLGVGGLINAYRTAAREALEAAQVVEKEEEVELSLTFPYQKMHLVMDFLKKEKIQILDQSLEAVCAVKILVSKQVEVTVKARLAHIIGAPING